MGEFAGMAGVCGYIESVFAQYLSTENKYSYESMKFYSVLPVYIVVGVLVSEWSEDFRYHQSGLFK